MAKFSSFWANGGQTSDKNNDKSVTLDLKGNNPLDYAVDLMDKQREDDISNKTNALYGQSQAKTGQDVQKVKRLREQSLTGEDPMSDYIRRSASRRIAAAKGGREGGVSGAELAQLDRQTSLDFQQNYTQNLTSYQNLIGNMLSGQASYDLGQEALYNAQNAEA